MRKDIEIKEVKDVAVALVPRQKHEEDHDLFWDAWLINLKQDPIQSVLVNSTGYGERNGNQVKTGTMRYFWEMVDAGMAVKIEPVQIDLSDIANEFWLSFSYQNYLFDRKYVFMPGVMQEINLIHIPVLDRKGVVIR